MKARAFIGAALLLFATGAARDGFDRWVDATVLPATVTESSVEVTARDGSLLRVFPAGDGLMRLATAPHQADARYLAMLLAYEDKRFRQHAGVDPLALLRAGAQALWHGRIRSGGSTLTMQVARLLEDGPTGSFTGKLRQMRVALALERRLSKDRILGLYLTHAPFGGNLEGLRAATFAWFGKEPRRLRPAEAALLIALPQSPETRRPDRHAETARRARNHVIARMANAGLLTGEEAETASAAPLPPGMKAMPKLAPHLADHLRASDPTRERFATTIDRGAQEALERLALRASRAAPDQVTTAIIAADIHSGAVLAHVGSAAYAPERQGFVDMTKALRSPGSLLKPLVYGLAFDRGLAHPETLIHDGPVRFGTYAPQNFDRRFRGDVTVRRALQLSLNIPVVRLTESLGPTRLLAALKKAGADPQLTGGRPGLAIALGGMGMSLSDLVQLYGILAAGGTGPGLHSTPPEAGESHTILSPVAAWQVSNILAGLAPPPGAPRGVLAYKTGTSYGHRDAWAIGFDGEHVVGVWMGRADGTPVPGAFGGDLAAPVLFEAFARLKPAFAPLPAPPPSTLILPTADLPQPLRRFGPASASDMGPDMVFPPDGARIGARSGALTVKLRGGKPPYTILANGAPVAIRARHPEVDIPDPGPGFSTLVVIDSLGRAAKARIEMLPSQE